MKIYTLSEYLRKEYGCKVYKLSLNAGCTCPNRDGKISTGGCTFCSAGGSGDFAPDFVSIEKQIEEAKKLVDSKFPKMTAAKERKYIAYFQSFTNTYGNPERLRGIFMEAINRPEIAVLSIGTRPDCLGPEIMTVLQELNRIKPVWVELGLQTIHEKTAVLVNRGYSLPVFEDAYRRLKDSGLKVIVHVILGLPGESESEMLETVAWLSRMDPVLDGIKLQLLHVLKGTSLAVQYEKNPFHIFTLEEYCDLVVKCLRLLPPETVVHRITGDGPKKLLVAPLWSGNKKLVLNTINAAVRKS